MSRRVLVDATSIPALPGGVSRYIEGLLSGLQDSGVAGELVVVAKAVDVPRIAQLVPEASLITAPIITHRPQGRLMWEQTGLSHLISRTDVDVVHSPHYTMPMTSPRPVVCTLHDATFFTEPGVHRAVRARFFRNWTRVSVRRAARIVVPSYATRDQLLKVVHLDSGRTVVAYHGVDRRVFHPPTTDEVQRFRAAYSLEGPYVAFLGTLEPRKNVPTLIRSFASLPAPIRNAHSLVLAGSRGWDPSVAREIRMARAHGASIRELGYVPNDLLPALLGGSEVVAYPSLGEGFGLPVLEAMSSGATVLTTDRLALPEVGGPGVAYCHPDVRAVSRALELLLTDPQERRRLQVSALARSDHFTWRASAEQHLSAYDAAVRDQE